MRINNRRNIQIKKRSRTHIIIEQRINTYEEETEEEYKYEEEEEENEEEEAY